MNFSGDATMIGIEGIDGAIELFLDRVQVSEGKVSDGEVNNNKV